MRNFADPVFVVINVSRQHSLSGSKAYSSCEKGDQPIQKVA
jgi:hypothetical protein